MKIVLLMTLAGSMVMLSACQRDPGRDVKPMADPIGGAAAPAGAPLEVIPLDKVRKSQAAAVSQRIASTEITVTYSRPVARGRELFGGIVPFDRVWNPGADQATAVAFNGPVHVNDQPLAAGKYSVWAIPGPERWTMILNKAGDVYHDKYPGEAQDALRLDISPERGAHMEALMFYFPIVEGKDAVLRLHWGEVMVPLSIRVP